MSTTAIHWHPKVGDILSEYWGYDETRVDFWAVTAVSPSGRVKLVPVSKEWSDDNWSVRPNIAVDGSFIPGANHKALKIKGYRVVKHSDWGSSVRISDYSSALPVDDVTEWHACTNPAFGR
jgi:hypothetical protein